MKRVKPRAQGRAYRIEKRMSHITVVLNEKIGGKSWDRKLIRTALESVLLKTGIPNGMQKATSLIAW